MQELGGWMNQSESGGKEFMIEIPSEKAYMKESGPYAVGTIYSELNLFIKFFSLDWTQFGIWQKIS